MPTAAAEKLEPPAASGLEQKLDKLVEVMTQFLSVQMQSAQGQSSTAIQSPRTSSAKSAQPQQSTSEPEEATPRQRRRTSQTEEMTHRAIDELIKHNSTPEMPHDRKWAITVNGLKAFVKSQRKIEQVLAERKAEIEAHHHQHQLDPATHNYRHRGKQAINQVIHI